MQKRFTDCAKKIFITISLNKKEIVVIKTLVSAK